MKLKVTAHIVMALFIFISGGSLASTITFFETGEMFDGRVGARDGTGDEHFPGIDVDSTSLTFGVTAHILITGGTSIFGNFSALKGKVEATDGATTFKDDDTGNKISVGLRHMATDVFELEINFSRDDVFDDTSNTFGFGARFYANEKFSLGIGYKTSSDIDTLFLNARIDI